MALPDRQRQILDFLSRFAAAHGYPPTIADIQKQFKLRSPSTVHSALSALVKKGYIRRTPNAARGIEILQTAEVSGDCRIPLLGIIAAGKPIEAVLNSEERDVPRQMVKSSKTFALIVSGDSMLGDGILDGDIVVVEPARTAANGKTVVALINGSEATLKRFRRVGNILYLEPANPRYKTIEIRPPNYVEIQGVLIGVVRYY